MLTRPLIALMTDFGLADGYPGIMKGVVLGIAPDARFVDLTHLVPPQDIATGAWILHTAWRYFPAGTIFLCVVDPGVGSARRPIALHGADRFFVGPDNGLFSYALSDVLAVNSPVAAVTLDHPGYHLPTPSATFHGRDIFAPSAAHLAAGVALTSLGTPLDPTRLVMIAPPQPSWEDGLLVGAIAHIDHFGNLITSFGPELAGKILATPMSALTIGAVTISARAETFAAGPQVAQPFLLRDSSGHLAIAVRNGSAAATLGVARGARVEVSGLA
jgi:S-adenosylmethionine hydrolase